MYSTNLAYAEYPAENFESAANAATIEPTGVFAARRPRRPTLASFKDIYASEQRLFRIF